MEPNLSTSSKDLFFNSNLTNNNINYINSKSKTPSFHTGGPSPSTTTTTTTTNGGRSLPPFLLNEPSTSHFIQPSRHFPGLPSPNFISSNSITTSPNLNFRQSSGGFPPHPQHAGGYLPSLASSSDSIPILTKVQSPTNLQQQTINEVTEISSSSTSTPSSLSPPFFGSLSQSCPNTPVVGGTLVSPPMTPQIRSFSGRDSNNQRCILSYCKMCHHGSPSILVKNPTWAIIMRVVFYTLKENQSDKEFFNLKTEVYGFMISHWERLCINRKRSDNWKKQIQDMLSHSKDLFESGMEHFRQNGFWKLKQNDDPWGMQKKKVMRKSSSSIGLTVSQEKKKRTKENADIEEETISVDTTTNGDKPSKNIDIQKEKEKIWEELSDLKIFLSKIEHNLDSLMLDHQHDFPSLLSVTSSDIGAKEVSKKTQWESLLKEYAHLEETVLEQKRHSPGSATNILILTSSSDTLHQQPAPNTTAGNCQEHMERMSINNIIR
eukprot:gene12053-14104_t